MPDTILRRMPWSSAPEHDPKQLLDREWVVTNGLGGYASGTVAWFSTRRYHGLLIAALPAPLGRMMMFNHLDEEMRLSDERIVRLCSSDPRECVGRSDVAQLTEFRLEYGLPVWRFEFGP